MNADKNKPMISVIMGIYNCEDTLDAAISCIIHQTYNNWELIMCDDSSEDRTPEIAQKYVRQNPQKFVLLKNEKNIGLNKTLNNCLRKAKGEYIARMDADDLCSPERFEKEVQILQKKKDISIVSTQMLYFDNDGVYGQSSAKEYPEKGDFVYRTPFCHAPCMVRKEAYHAVGGYSVGDRLLRVEDYHLWIKMYAKGFKGYNIQEPLYQMRDDRDAYRRRKFKYRINEAYVKLQAVKMLGLPTWKSVYALKPLVVGVLPMGIYRILHKQNLKEQ